MSSEGELGVKNDAQVANLSNVIESHGVNKIRCLDGRAPVGDRERFAILFRS